tara:strand:- start:10246 stop:11058 length:813 start_codon:yes stop_codon:yes gene_type:complete
MSVQSYDLEQIYVDVDESLMYVIPDITVNKGGQITAITQGAINEDIESASVLAIIKPILDENQNVINSYILKEAVIQSSLDTLTAQITALNDEISTMTTNITALQDDAVIDATGFIEIFNNKDHTWANELCNTQFGAESLKRRQDLVLFNQSLTAGKYMCCFNFAMNSVNGNDDTRYKMMYIYIKSNDDIIGNTISNCSGHNAATMVNSTQYSFEITSTKTISITFNYDVACTSFTAQSDLIYNFNTNQDEMYPFLSGINSNIIQIFKVS